MNLKRIHPDTLQVHGSVMITIGDKATGTTMGTDRQRFFLRFCRGQNIAEKYGTVARQISSYQVPELYISEY